MIVRVVKKADDPTTPCRVLLGAAIDLAESRLLGYYCVYRGTKENAIAACEAALAALRELDHEPPVAPDDGKRYA
jgi:hypothetical protein